MRELSFLGLSDDAASLLLSGNDGERYSVALDERLSSAVRKDRSRLGQLDLAAQGLSPRDIQALIRAGHSAETVADNYGVSLDRVRRFEGPMIAERQFVASQAQATEIRRDEGAHTLGEVAAARLRTRGIDPSRLNWDAWRREDGRWTLVVTWPEGGADGQATWTYDTVGRSLHSVDDDAAWLLEESAVDVEEDIRPRLVGLPSVVEDVPEIEFVDEIDEAAPPPWHAEDDRHATGPVPSEPEPPAPAPRRGRKGKRASVPSWDEILFGSREPDS